MTNTPNSSSQPQKPVSPAPTPQRIRGLRRPATTSLASRSRLRTVQETRPGLAPGFLPVQGASGPVRQCDAQRRRLSSSSLRGCGLLQTRGMRERAGDLMVTSRLPSLLIAIAIAVAVACAMPVRAQTLKKKPPRTSYLADRKSWLKTTRVQRIKFCKLPEAV